MPTDLDVRVTPALDPETYRAVEGYNDDTRGYVDDVVNAFNDAYVTLGSVHTARERADENPGWTEEQRILNVGRVAAQQKERVSRRLDKAIADLKSRIAFTEGELSKPLKENAGLGTLNAEVRAYARTLNDKGRGELLTKALASDDTATLTALLGAQPFLSGLPQHEYDHFTHLYHAKQNPGLVARLAVMRNVQEVALKNSYLLHAQFERAIGAKPHRVSELEFANDRAIAALKIEPA